MNIYLKIIHLLSNHTHTRWQTSLALPRHNTTANHRLDNALLTCHNPLVHTVHLKYGLYPFLFSINLAAISKLKIFGKNPITFSISKHKAIFALRYCRSGNFHLLDFSSAKFSHCLIAHALLKYIFLFLIFFAKQHQWTGLTVKVSTTTVITSCHGYLEKWLFDTIVTYKILSPTDTQWQSEKWWAFAFF